MKNKKTQISAAIMQAMMEYSNYSKIEIPIGLNVNIYGGDKCLTEVDFASICVLTENILRNKYGINVELDFNDETMLQYDTLDKLADFIMDGEEVDI